MMKPLLFIILFFCINLKAQLLLKIEKDSLVTYHYAGGDEFNQKELSNEWNNAPWPRVIMSQDLAFQPDKVSLDNGLIKFEAVKNDSIYIMGDIEIDSSFLKRKKMTLNKNQFLTKYSAGLILSKKKYHYGLYELRFKVEEGKGIWPAF
ncbi:MAG: family 16 glycosylhydrolase, partial [Bacteroidia bacterium]